MEREKLKLPVGIEAFQDFRNMNYYYVDKTGFIPELLDNIGKANLFTRPRRFGKSLNMDMLKCFFEIGTKPSLFEGLAIQQNNELCEKYMGKYPVISISLKTVEGRDFASARKRLWDVISEEAGRFDSLQQNNTLMNRDKEKMMQLSEGIGELESSLRLMSNILSRAHDKNVIVLIDEYDVPLAKAMQNGYYEDMVHLIRVFLNAALKTNPCLEFAVLTGCLRVSKESIFTGLNNLTVFSLKNPECSRWFGFTEQEVKEMLHYYELDDFYSLTKDWYDGYRIGSYDVYNPWDVVNWVRQLRNGADTTPSCYWTNSSGNQEVETLIHKMGDGSTQDQLEALISGESMQKKVEEQLTYDTLYDSIDNLWSLLFAAGYLTMSGPSRGNLVPLKIPNEEIRTLFVEQIMKYFRDIIENEQDALDTFCEALIQGNTDQLKQSLDGFLEQTISIRDTCTKKDLREGFYHGILLGILVYPGNWIVRSNEESGIGYCDILIQIRSLKIGMAIETKYADDGAFDSACQKAMDQIEEKDYTQRLKREGMQTILKYGIAFYKKECMVRMEQEVL